MKHLKSLNTAILFSACCLGAVFVGTSFYPGLMSPDSINQLVQARAWQFSDWHPVAMGIVWNISDGLVPGPLGMLILHLTFFWTGLFLVALSLWSLGLRRASFLAPCIGILPAVLTIQGVIWKDIGFGAALLFCFGLLLFSTVRGARRIPHLAWPLLLYAALVRYNGWVAIIPFIAWILSSIPLFRNRRVLLCGSSLIITMFLGLYCGNALNKAVNAQPVHLSQFLAVTDITGCYVLSDGVLDYFPDYIKQHKNFSYAKLMNQYSPAGVQNIFFGDDAPLRFNANDEERRSLWRSWRNLVFEHPLVYLRHRLRILGALLATGERASFVIYPGTHANKLGYSYTPGIVLTTMQKVFSDGYEQSHSLWWSSSVWFKTWLWMLAAGVCCAVSALRRKRGVLTLARHVLFSSGVLYILSYAFVGVGADYRYVWWSVLAFILTLFLFLIDRERKVDACINAAPPLDPDGRA